MITLRHVAARAGASIGSVSAVLNNTAPVSPALRSRILQAIDELGYVPHAIAVSLKSGRSRMIGLVMPDITNPHFAELAQSIERVCDEAGLTLALCSTSDDHEKEIRQLAALRKRRVDGIIFIPGGLSPNDPARLREVISAPVVLLDRNVPELHADAVLLDNEGAARLLTEHLLALGHSRIGLIAGAKGIEISQRRLAGYRAALADHGVVSPDDLVVFGEFQAGPACEASLRLIDRGERPSALIATSNHTAIGLMKALGTRRLACPGTISVAAIDRLPWTEGFRPRLTVAVQPAEEMGSTAMLWLLDRITHREFGPPRVSVHCATLIAGDSTRPAAEFRNGLGNSGTRR